MESNFIQKAWLMLAKHLMLKPNSVQYIEMQRAFFAGAHSVIVAVKLAAEQQPEDGADICESVWQECEAFRVQLTLDPEMN